MEMDWPYTQTTMRQCHKEGTGLDSTGQEIKRKNKRQLGESPRDKEVDRHGQRSISWKRTGQVCKWLRRQAVIKDLQILNLFLGFNCCVYTIPPEW